MKAVMPIDEQVLIGANYAPAVSILAAFEPKMWPKSELDHKLKLSLAKAEKELLARYTSEQALPVIRKLQDIVHNLNYYTHKKSIAIFASPMIEKVFYLDIPVEDKVVIDESFEIRDLVYSKKQTIQYLILLLSGKLSKTYLGNCSRFVLIKSNVPASIHAYERDMPEQVTHFTDQHKHREIVLDKFLHHMDEGLSQILQSYPLPVFVMGTEKVTGHFKKITKNSKSIIQYIHGNYEDASESEIAGIVRPYVADWNRVRQQNLLQQIEKAMDCDRLVWGINGVQDAAAHKNGRLLIVEKDFMYPGRQAGDSGIPFYIKDAVDDVMEKVLESGGDVEFVDNDLLKEYDRIALIKYFH